MSRAAGRPRRTRIYGANYDIGQSLYKSAIDDLDRKQYGRSDRSEIGFGNTAQAPLSREDLDSDLQQARARAHRAITEEPLLFDSRGANVSARGFPLCTAFGDDDLDDDVQASLNRIRAARQHKLPALLTELNLDHQSEKVGASTLRSRASQNADTSDIYDDSLQSRGRANAFGLRDDSTVETALISRFKKTTFSDVVDSSESSASLRAKATKARLENIETDLFDRSEKQIQRERRAANLKKILADNDIEEVKSTKKVTF